jgi:hypothetical protein
VAEAEAMNVLEGTELRLAAMTAERDNLDLIIEALNRSELRITSAGGSWTLREFMAELDLARYQPAEGGSDE